MNNTLRVVELFAGVGDGLVMDRPNRARGTVQLQKAPTLVCTRGGGLVQ